MLRTYVMTCLLIGIFAAFSAAAQTIIPGEVIVKIKRTSAPSAGHVFAAQVKAERGIQLKNHWAKLSLYHFALPPGKTVDSAIQELSTHPDVEYVEPVFQVQKSSLGGVARRFTAEQVTGTGTTMVSPGDIGLSQYYQMNVSRPQVALNDRPIVAVIDTGLDTNHYVMQDTKVVWTNPGEIPDNGIDDDGNGFVDDVHGWNFVSNSPNVYDDDGHGTHVSGIILSVDQDIFAKSLQTAKIQIMPLKFLDASGSGSTADAIKAIYYAIDKGAVVLNNSWGGSDYSSALNEAIAYSYNHGATFVAAAGNASSNNDASPMYPASYDVPNVMSVAAISDNDALASFSNYGASTVGLGSLGVYILSTLPGGYFGEMSGTSMATPFVSGTAAQMKVVSSGMLGHQVRSIIMQQTTNVFDLQNKVQTSGKLNVVNAINAASTSPVDPSQPAYTLTYQPDRTLAGNLAGGGCGMVYLMDDRRDPPDQGLGSIGITLALVLAPLAYLVFRRFANPANRRKFERFRIKSEVRIQVGDRELVGSVSTISLGGAKIDTSALLQDGGLVTLTIASPSGDERVEVEGRVVWSEANKSYGVAFDHAPASVLSCISGWTKALQRAS